MWKLKQRKIDMFDSDHVNFWIWAFFDQHKGTFILFPVHVLPYGALVSRK